MAQILYQSIFFAIKLMLKNKKCFGLRSESQK